MHREVVFILAFVSATLAQEDSPAAGRRLNAEIVTVLSMVEQNRINGSEALKLAESVPLEASVETLVWEIENGGRRKVAYGLLFGLQSARTEAGFEMLLRALRNEDPSIRAGSSRSLGASPEERSAAASVALGEALLTERDATVRDDIVRALGNLGSEAAAPYAAELEEVLLGANLDVGERERAAFALLRIQGTSRAMSVLNRIDSRGGHAFLRALVLVGAETGGGFGTDEPGREVVRSFAFSFADNPDKSVRHALVDLLPFLVGPDPSSSDPAQLTINKRVTSVAEAMLREESNEGRRNDLNRFLGAFDKDGRIRFQPKP